MHKQRFTVLLLMGALMMVIFYMSSIFNIKSLIINLDFMIISTTYMTFSVLIDQTSLSFSALVCFISGCVFMFSQLYMKDDMFYQRFIWVLVSFVMSMNILVFSGSLPMLLIGWDGLGVSSFALIIYYDSRESMNAGFLTLMINRIGDVLIMGTVFYLVLKGSGIIYISGSMNNYGLIFLLSVAALTKSAQYPFSAWLPAAMAAPTPVSALVHSSTLVTAGVYILIRTQSMLSVTSEMITMMLFCGAATSLMGGMCAMIENDIKKIVAFSTLSQLGVMVFSLGLISPGFALLHLYTHAMFKAMLFLVAGCVLMMSFGVQDIRLLGGILKSSPMLLIFLNTSAFCLMGVPFLSAYYSKHSILSLMMSSSLNMFSMLLMVLAVILSSAYMVRMLKLLNLSARFTPMMTKIPPSIFFPIFMLWTGAVFYGWICFQLDNKYLGFCEVPAYVNWLFNSIIFMGVVLGLLSSSYGGSLLIVSMFFMDPLWRNSNKLSNPLISKVKMIEMGWLEPHTYIKTFDNIMLSFMTRSTWGNNNFNFINYVLILMMIYFVIM